MRATAPKHHAGVSAPIHQSAQSAPTQHIGVYAASHSGPLAPASCEANPTAVLDTTGGKIEVELFLDRVPRTASNFIDLARSGFYNGIHFHRVVSDRMSPRQGPEQLHGGYGAPVAGTLRMRTFPRIPLLWAPCPWSTLAVRTRVARSSS